MNEEPPLEYHAELKCWFIVKGGILIANAENRPIAIAWKKDWLPSRSESDKE